MANAANSGNKNTVQNAAPPISTHSDRRSAGRCVPRRTRSPAPPAIVIRAAVRNSGSRPVSARRVAGRVPANRHIPKKPSNEPSLWREVVIVGPGYVGGGYVGLGYVGPGYVGPGPL